MNSPVIKPTIGRRVWFRPSGAFLASNPILTQFNPEQPMDAGIVYVHHDHMVNLIVTDHVGKTLAVPSVPLLAGHYVADEDTDVYCCCEWMPYQKSQAAKTEVADKGIVLEPKYREPTQREQLEYALVSGAASALAISPGNARQVVDGINVVLDTLHPLPTLSNPHTGTPRDPRDVASDPQAVLCVKPGEPLKSAAMASGIVIPPIGAPSAGATAASLLLPVVDPGPDSMERAMESKTYQDGTTAFGPAPLPDVSPALWAKPLAKEVPELTVSLSDLGLEREIQAKGLTAPRVTPFEVEAHIRSEFYFTAEQGVLGESELGTRPASWTNLDQVTICVLILTNGTKIVGVNEGPVSRENFKADLGRQYARQKAVDQIWPLLGFRLRDELARTVLTDADAAADLAGTPRPDNPTAESADFLANVKACDLSGDAPCEACQ